MAPATPMPDCAYCRPDQACLFHTIVEDDVSEVRTTLAREPEVLYGDRDAFRLAMERRSPDVGALLAALGVDLRVTDTDWGRSVMLNAAVADGQVDAIGWLLDHGAYVDGNPNTSTPPLAAAAVHGHLEITRMLLAAGAEIDRESLRRPATALDWAVIYGGIGREHAAVAELLREHGATRPYDVPADWTGVRGQAHLEHIQEALWHVHPRGVERTLASGRTVAIHRSRFSPRSWRHQLLFTVEVAETAGVEIALCLPSEWPLNRMSLQEDEYRWPYELLFSLAEWLTRAGTLAHGDVVGPEHPGVAAVAWQPGISRWLVARHERIASRRPDGVAETLILLPVTEADPLVPGADARARADRAAATEWGPTHVVPLGYRASWLTGPTPVFAAGV